MSLDALRRLASPLGELVLAANDTGLSEVRSTGIERSPLCPAALSDAALAHLDAAEAALIEYFAGARKDFDDLQLAPRGSAFQRSVWSALEEIPFGRTATYGELAERIGNPKAARAVGMANNRNPIAIILPCHRVIGADGRLVGYAGGLAMKHWLLDHEGVASGALFPR